MSCKELKNVVQKLEAENSQLSTNNHQLQQKLVLIHNGKETIEIELYEKSTILMFVEQELKQVREDERKARISITELESNLQETRIGCQESQQVATRKRQSLKTAQGICIKNARTNRICN